MSRLELHQASGLLKADEHADAATKLRESVIAPVVNSALIEPYNALAGVVNAAAKPVTGADLLSRTQELKTANADFLSTGWLVQSASAGLGMLIPYKIAGRFAGAALRTGGEAFAVKGSSARFLQSQASAQIIGAAVYDGIRETRPGETHMGNALGGAAAFSVFQAGHAFTKELPLLGQLASRATVGSLGAVTQQTVSGLYSNHELPSIDNLGKAAVSGMVMNMVLPEAQRALSAGVDHGRMSLGLGVPQDRYLDSSKILKASAEQSPTALTLLNEAPWARVQTGAKINSFDAGKQIVYLSEGKDGIENIGRELSRIKENRSEPSRDALKSADDLRQQGNFEESWNTYRSLRLKQEAQAQHVENAIAKELGKTNQLLSPNDYAKEIAAWPSGGGLSHERRWRQEFVEFDRSEGQRGPGITNGAKGEYMPASAAESMPPSRESIIASDVVRTLQEADELAVLAGGPVRDELMGRQPKDFDIATSASPDKVEKLFADKGIKVLSVGKQFGTIKLIIDGEQIEVTTLRTDGNYTDGRRPDKVQYANSLAEDGARRDLTMNAMYKDPLTNNYFDLFGGREDIAARRIRSVGDPMQRFSEDNLRMMRVPRFAARYGFDVDPDTFAAIKENSVNLNKVSSERIREEMRGILAAPKPSIGLDMMMNSGLMERVIPEMLPMDGPKGKQDPIWHPEGTAWTHTKMVVDHLALNGNGKNFPLMMGGLLHDIAKPLTMVEKPDGRISNPKHDVVGAEMAKDIAQRLKLSKNDVSLIEKIVAQHMTMHAVREMRPGTLATLLKKPEIPELIEMQNADANGKGVARPSDASHRQWLQQKLEELKQAEDPNKRLDAKPIVDGNLVAELGFPKTSVRSEIIKAASDAQHEGAFSNAEQAREWILKNYSQNLRDSARQ